MDRIAFKDSLANLHGNTVHAYVTVLKIFFLYCVLLDLIEKSPAVKLRSPKVSRRPPVFLTESESLRLMAGVDRSSLYGKRDYAILAVLLSTGIRVGEVVHVRLSDLFVDDSGDIFLNVLKGKGGKARRVKVPAETFAAVQEFATAVCRWQPLGPRSMPLCLHLRGHKQWERGDVPLVRMSTRQVQATVTGAAKRAGIQKQVSPHTLRHTCFTLEMMEGANLLEIKEQAGHDYLGTTQKYLHLVDSMKHNAVDRNPLFLKARPYQEKEKLKRNVVDRLERLGVSKKLVETVREELSLGWRDRRTHIDEDLWMPLREAVKAVVHLSRSARTARQAMLKGGVRTITQDGQSWAWRDHVQELVEDFLPLKASAELYGINERTVRRWLKEGTLSADADAKPWGGKWIVRASSLSRLLGKSRTRTGQIAGIKPKRGHKKAPKKG